MRFRESVPESVIGFKRESKAFKRIDKGIKAKVRLRRGKEGGERRKKRKEG